MIKHPSKFVMNEEIDKQSVSRSANRQVGRSAGGHFGKSAIWQVGKLVASGLILDDSNS
ncbi:MAG: hypothetical protein ACK40X_08645 [Armatimonadota bacterium]